MAGALAAMTYRPHAALAPRAATADTASRARLAAPARRAPAGRSLALRVAMGAKISNNRDANSPIANNRQGFQLALVQSSAQRKRFQWARGCI
jgi:hypothetical protein